MAEKIQSKHQSFFDNNPEMHAVLDEYKRFRDLGGASLVLFTHYMEARMPLLEAAKKHETNMPTVIDDNQPEKTLQLQ